MIVSYKAALAALTCVVGFAQMPAANAALLYEYNRGPGNFGPSRANPVVSYDSINATFHTGTEQLTWTVDFGSIIPSSAWVVFSPGPNPKGATDELGIAYLDQASGDAWIYAYNGRNSNDSYRSGPLLEYLPGAYQYNGDVATFAFDSSGVNAQLTSGFAFGPSIGIWYHPVIGGAITGDASGISLFGAGSQRWLDTSLDGDCLGSNGCITTTNVSAPASAALLGIGMLAMVGRRFRLALK
ncbi:MAG: hypothetical protein AB8C46_13655 [Burkholderiaceae bacterium]